MTELSKTHLEWLNGQVSLGAAMNWTAHEIRLVVDLAYSLAEQGRDREAIIAFEGLSALAPATAYFQSALGGLKLRVGDWQGALTHLNRALASDPRDTYAMVNRGEVYLHLGNRAAAKADFLSAVALSGNPSREQSPLHIQRARGLLINL